jgi:hypothetical protein
MSAGRKIRTIVAQVEGTPLPPESDAAPSGGQRNIPKGHDFDARALKPLSRALFSASVSLGHAVTAYKEFARVKSSSVSPDGMLGGRGYVMKVKEIRGQIQQACELLSAVTDTLYDEVTAPHWKPKVAELSENEAEDIDELVGEAGRALEDPESVGQKNLDEVESRNDKDGEAEGGASEMPETGGPETASPPMDKQANSSIPVTTLPGPRVDHLDRGEQTGPGGSYNVDERPVDNWDNGPEEDVYVSVFAQENKPVVASKPLSNEELAQRVLARLARSGVPDATTEPTETEANDFGIGYGAKGKGTEGYGETAPDGRGVAGPSSDLPSDPGGKTKDQSEGAAPYMDGIERNLWACSGVPEAGPPARSDYFLGDKGNQFNVSLGESEMPGTDAMYNYDRNTPNTGESVEHQDVPYVKYDWTTHNYRNDPQDLYRYDDKVGSDV